MYKIFAVAALLAVVSAADHQATSFVKFNDNHNAVHHIQSAPAYSAPSYHAPAAPAYAAPAVAKEAVPAVAKYAVPVAAKYAAPAAPAYYSAPAYPAYSSAPSYSYSSAPAVAKVALPAIAKVAAPAYKAYKEEEYAPIPYQYAYAVQDPHTGDYHSQEETSDGHHVSGQYSLHEADGTIRIVKYSDDGHGFNAVVEKQGEPTPAPAAYKKIVAAPHY
ncbi:cuticle protein 16.5-like [Sitophilus oryzae]|uniref:Cuticle protein 16.5-like n=1 Tax=Sitophilus oryzae TaxID=7048 RepID=A0A6J2XF21_SITOR|nr:cuticle protein 16.5-like [Sitophilus oryzae]